MWHVKRNGLLLVLIIAFHLFSLDLSFILMCMSGFCYMFMCTAFMLDFLGDQKSCRSLSGTGFRIAVSCYGCSRDCTQVVWQRTVPCNIREISSASTSTVLRGGLSRLFSMRRSQLAGLSQSFISRLTLGVLKFQMSTMVVSSRLMVPRGSNNSNSHSRGKHFLIDPSS